MGFTRPLALPSCLPTELLEFVLRQRQDQRTTLIVCATRQDFLSSLLDAIIPAALNQASDLPRDGDADESQSQLQRHPLLINTLHQIAVSQSTHIAFVPSVSHLRAYLSVYSSANQSKVPLTSHPSANASAPVTRLIVYGLVDSHRDTSEWSAQGLGGTVAAAVEASSRSGQSLLLVDSLLAANISDHGENDAEQSSEARDDGRLKDRRLGWQEHMPMLNGSVRRQLDTDDSGEHRWLGRTVQVAQVLARWCLLADKAAWEDELP